MIQIQFPDRMVSYDTFVNDIAASIVKQLKESHEDPEMVSQRSAYRIFGRGNVDRWRKKGLLSTHKRPGKVEYSTVELRRCQSRQQDYFP
ncbi:MAG: hypothetical protein IJS63_09455 [Bacteroidaceae bacterium]|nr:hypothetical protein [Bacteroidaceae bacterium]